MSAAVSQHSDSSKKEDYAIEKSPKTLRAVFQLGYTLNDYKKVSREQIIEQEREKLFRVPKERVNEYIDLRFQHSQQSLQQKVEQLQEMKMKLDQKNNPQKDNQRVLESASLTLSSQSKEEFLKKEKIKIDKLQEQQKKQIDFLLKSQIEADELRKREEVKKEKIRQLEEKKLLDQRMRQLETEQQRTEWELKSQQLEKEKKREEEMMIKKYEEKQENVKQKLEEKEREMLQKREEKEQKREILELKIDKKREEQLKTLEDIHQQYEKRVLMNEIKLKEQIEKRERDFSQRRETSENRRKYIQDQFHLQEQHREAWNQQRVKISEDKDLRNKQNELVQEEKRRTIADWKNNKIEKVRDQFRRLMNDLDQKNNQQELKLKSDVQKANKLRESKLQDTSFMQYQHQLEIEGILTNSRRINSVHQISRQLLMQKIKNDTNKVIQTQQERYNLAKIKEQILNEHDKQKQELIKEVAMIQKGTKNIYTSQYLLKSDEGNSHFKRNSSLPNSHNSSTLKSNNNINLHLQSNAQNLNKSINASNSSTYNFNNNQSSTSFQKKTKLQSLTNKLEGSKQLNQSKVQEQQETSQLKNSDGTDIQTNPQQKQNNSIQGKGKTRNSKVSRISLKNESFEINNPGKFGTTTSRSILSGIHSQDSNNHEIMTSQRVRQRQLEYSNTQSCRNTSKKFLLQHPLSLKGEKYNNGNNSGIFQSNKFIQSQISEQYVEDLGVLQKQTIQDMKLILEQQFLSQGKDEFDGQLESISKELLDVYKKQEAKKRKFHSQYAWFPSH